MGAEEEEMLPPSPRPSSCGAAQKAPKEGTLAGRPQDAFSGPKKVFTGKRASSSHPLPPCPGEMRPALLCWIYSFPRATRRSRVCGAGREEVFSPVRWGVGVPVKSKPHVQGKKDKVRMRLMGTDFLSCPLPWFLRPWGRALTSDKGTARLQGGWSS